MGRSKMSMYQGTVDRPPWAAWFALLNSEFLAAVRSHRVNDALFVFGLVVLPMVAIIAVLFLISSTAPSAALHETMDGTGMAILPP